VSDPARGASPPPPHAAALPFVLRRAHDVIRAGEITSTREQLHGLLRLDGDGERVVVQWSVARETSRVGREIRTDRELGPVREVVVPLASIAGARLRRVWRRWPPGRGGDLLVLTAADLRAFEGLAGGEGVPGLVLEHPAELTVELRRQDREAAREFVAELELALAEQALGRALRAAERTAPLGAGEARRG
jgi:hypothetical protein